MPVRGSVMAQAANLLSGSRFAFAALWLATFLSGNRRPEIMGAIAVCAAVSDFIDGRIAHRMRSADAFGRWLDNLADVVFVLTALGCEVRAGAIPWYIPALIAASFTQYAIDSVAISGSSIPVKSRFGHWGGVINYTLVIVLAWAPAPRWAGTMLRELSPIVALFYLAAMFERVLGYRQARAIHGSA